MAGFLLPARAFSRTTNKDATLNLYWNALFSVARFRELTHTYPALTLGGHSFKRCRFNQIHRLALR